MKSYSLKSGSGGGYLPHWCIEGSEDGNKWQEIDKRDTQDLKGDYIVKNYECDSDRTSDEFYRYIRLRQTRLNSLVFLNNSKFVDDQQSEHNV